ncbi:MAG: apolipoprotein N-acyltransferase [Myxococcota bacterium]|nr:apolipoprotein N-acyltransferase [Myxococcota bacterium]
MDGQDNQLSRLRRFLLQDDGSIRLRIALTVAALVLIHLSYPSGRWPVLAALGFLGWAALIRKTSPKHGLALGFVFGFGLFFGGSYGLMIAFNALLYFSWLKAALFAAVFSGIGALPYALFGLVSSVFASWGPVRRALCLSVLQVFFFGVFPVTPVHFLFQHPILFQILDLGGLCGLNVAFNLIVFLGIEIWYAARKKRALLIYLTAFILICSGVVGYGCYQVQYYENKINAADPNQLIHIAAIQPNIPVKKHDQPLFVQPEDRKNDLSTLLELSQTAAQRFPDTDLLVWPELPIIIPCKPLEEDLLAIRSLIQRIRKPIVFACEQDLSDHQQWRYHNTALHLSDTGAPGKRYHKQILVPFAEYLPFERKIPLLRQIFQNTRYYVPGDGAAVFEIGPGKKIIPTICYEILFSNHIRKFALNGGNILLNLTNEAYFGKTVISDANLSMGVFRAVEYRMPLVKVTNSGNGFFASATGKIIKNTTTPRFQTKISQARLYIPNEKTLFLRIGPLIEWLLFVLFVLTAAYATYEKVIKPRQ